MEMLKGMGLLLFALLIFSVFSIKAPKGQKAMSGLANAAVASFLVEAIHKYIFGDFLEVYFLGEVGGAAGSMGGVAAAILVGLNMGVNPVYAVAAGISLTGMGILPGFIAGYIVGLVGPILEKKLPKGIDIITGVLLIAPFARLIAVQVAPVVDETMLNIGDMILVAANQSPILMGFLLGGIMKILCTSPLSSMALTAMLGLHGLPMGIAAIACVGGSFTNGMIFKKLKFGNASNIVGVMLEPLTQADIVCSNPLPIFASNLLGGGLAGISAAYFGIINNAPGTASPIPGLLAPLAFNDPLVVMKALFFAIIGGIVGGWIGGIVFKFAKKEEVEETNKRMFKKEPIIS
ncbi:PTS sugar transporter subunit IIC [Clostridiaceae bacterium 35-E11]